MRREWEPEELIACWTLVDADWRLVANTSGATRLGFAVLPDNGEIEFAHLLDPLGNRFGIWRPKAP